MKDGFAPTLSHRFSFNQAKTVPLSCRILDGAWHHHFWCIHPIGVVLRWEVRSFGKVLFYLMDLKPGLFSNLFWLNYPQKKLSVKVAQNLAKKASIVFANPAFLISGTPFGKTDAEAIAFRVWGCGRENISNIYGRHGRGWISLYGISMFLTNGKETNIGPISLSTLMKRQG